jgi:hypothetical protein
MGPQAHQMTIEFSCKDPVLTRYCEAEWGPKFAEMLDQGIDQDRGLEIFRGILRKEAQRQEWYDYVEIPGMVPGTTSRSVLMEDGKPKLLVPEVRIVP